MCSRDVFHDSPSDVVPHAGVVYEDENGNHLSKKHVAERAEDQEKVSQQQLSHHRC
jgi:hypothetical protein